MSQELPPVKLKGKMKKEHVFQPLTERKTLRTHVDLGLQGRTEEYTRLRVMLATAAMYNNGGTIVLTGERGSGKTALVKAVRKIAHEARMAVLEVESTKSKRKKRGGGLALPAGPPASGNTMVSTPADASLRSVFWEWQGILDKLILRASHTLNVPPVDYIMSQLSDAQKPFVSDLNYVIPSLCNGIPRQMEFRELDGHRRVDKIAELILALLLGFARKQPTAILLHLQTGTDLALNLGMESWGLTHMLVRACEARRTEKVPPLVVCVISRPLPTGLSVQIQEIVEIADANDTLLELRPLSYDARRDYLAQVLTKVRGFEGTASDIPEELVWVVSDRAAGNPKHTMEMVNALFAHDAVFIADASMEHGGKKMVRVRPHRNLYDVPIPTKLLGTVKQVLDALSERHRTIVRNTSVMEAFSYRMVLGVFGEENSGHLRDLSTDLLDLLHNGVIEEVYPIPEMVLACHPNAAKAYIFQNRLLQEVAFNSLLAKVRDKLHARVEAMMAENDRGLHNDAATVIQRCYRAYRERKSVATKIEAKIREMEIACVEEHELDALFGSLEHTLRELAAVAGDGAGSGAGAAPSAAPSAAPARVFTPTAPKDPLPFARVHSRPKRLSRSSLRKKSTEV